MEITKCLNALVQKKDNDVQQNYLAKYETDQKERLKGMIKYKNTIGIYSNRQPGGVNIFKRVVKLR